MEPLGDDAAGRRVGGRASPASVPRTRRRTPFSGRRTCSPGPSGLAGGALVRNPAFSCGGLFQDFHGPGWEPHLDANCTVPGHRRRLTLLLYLNREWRPEWGGELELYADARGFKPKKIAPLFNRAVLLACHDRAWHGVAPISLPVARRREGRRALIVNFYGAERRDDAPMHYNRWLPRPLPKDLREGGRLTPREAAAAERSLDRRADILRELRSLESAVHGGAVPAAPARPRLLPGRPLSSAQARELRLLAARSDREIRRLYSLEYRYRSLLSCASR